MVGTCTYNICRGLTSCIHTKKNPSIFMLQSSNFLRFVLFPNFCSEILRKDLFLESHRNFMRDSIELNHFTEVYCF